jgi:hypothetical protein
MKDMDVPSLIPLAAGFRSRNTLILNCLKKCFHPLTHLISSNNPFTIHRTICIISRGPWN